MYSTINYLVENWKLFLEEKEKLFLNKKSDSIGLKLIEEEKQMLSEYSNKIGLKYIYSDSNSPYFYYKSNLLIKSL